ncbi:MAG: DUF2490 domain-containing protein [Chitinophagaceae bacterium]|nr:MAG: DUF2490 domain-containing protein [Chitinophagaceae bacterium]
MHTLWKAGCIALQQRDTKFLHTGLTSGRQFLFGRLTFNQYSLRMKYTACCLIAATLLFAGTARSQTQYSGWLASFNTIKTGKHTSIHSDVQLRSNDGIEHVQTLLLRAGLNYHAGKKFIITAGYAFVHNRRSTAGISGYLPEHRIWEQVIYNHKLSRVNVSHRLRIEQRFISRAAVDGNELVRNGHFTANRIRYFIRNVIPFHKAETFRKGPFAAVQNEVFLNFGNKANVNGKGFDQNRFYVAAGYRLNPGLDLEAGYMNQYISLATGRTNNHIAQLAVYIRR